ncbi:MAG TPA: hypothetical protein PLJ21_09750 [Pseudobdellovibrionaceae bacterium]|mgnify:CR=1 FL=1|nr:hypothetical protein [Pseudobdellovibrionaceae bacterium]
MSYQKIKFSFVFLSFLLSLSCKKAEETTAAESIVDNMSNIVDSAVGSASSQANAIVYSGMLLAENDFETQSAFPYATCSLSAARSSCSGSTISINWNDCTIGSSSVTATVAGLITETYSGFGAGVCMMNGNNSVLTRKVDDSSPRKITFTAPASLSGAIIISKMNPDTAYDGTTFPQATTGTVISKLESGTSNALTCSVGAPCYNIVANGTQNTMTGPLGTKWFDHILTSDLTAQGVRSAGTLSMSGTSSVWHQVAQYKAVNTFNSVVWGDSSCCFPTSGSITSLVTGSITGTATTAFSTTCGSATFTDVDGNSSTITLKQCQP